MTVPGQSIQGAICWGGVHATMIEDGTKLDGAPALSQGRGRAAFGFIFVSAVASAMSIGIMVPILPNLLKQFSGGDTATASEWNVTFAVAGGLMSFFAGPVLGQIGRAHV